MLEMPFVVLHKIFKEEVTPHKINPKNEER